MRKICDETCTVGTLCHSRIVLIFEKSAKTGTETPTDSCASVAYAKHFDVVNLRTI